MVLVRSISVCRFKAIEKIDVDLGRVTTLVGSNNSGKSSILQAVQFAVSVAQSLYLNGDPKSSSGEVSGTLASHELVYTPLRDVQALAAGGALTQKAESAIEVVFLTEEFGNVSITVRRGKNKNIAVRISNGALRDDLRSMDRPFSVVAPGLAGIPSFEEYKSQGIVQRAAARGDANSVFRNVLWSLKGNEGAWIKFQESLSRIFLDLSVGVDFNEQTDEYLGAYLVRNGLRLPIDSSGTGVLQAVQVLSYIGLYRPHIVILDEPDSHLHPDNQRKLIRLLSDLAEEDNFQILMSTHSRHLLEESYRLGAKVHWISSGEIRESDFDKIGVLLDLGALDAGDRLRNGKTSVIVITEDTEFSYLRTILLSCGLEEGTFDIWSYSSSSKIDSAIVLAKFIKEHAHGVEVVIHRDRDYIRDCQIEDYELAIKKAGAHPFVTKGTDIESYFLNTDYLCSIFPAVSEEGMREVLQRATEETLEKSIKIMINAWDESKRGYYSKLGEDVPSAGSIAALVRESVSSDPVRYRHGKSTLKAVKRILQSEYGINEKIDRPSPFLKVDVISAVADRLDL